MKRFSLSLVLTVVLFASSAPVLAQSAVPTPMVPLQNPDKPFLGDTVKRPITRTLPPTPIEVLAPMDKNAESADQSMMMRKMGMMRGRGLMGGGLHAFLHDHMEGSLAFLKTELKIAPNQNPAWEEFATNLRAQAEAESRMSEKMERPKTWSDGLSRQEETLSQQLEAVRAMKAAALKFEAVLTSEQKQSLNQMMSMLMG